MRSDWLETLEAVTRTATIVAVAVIALTLFQKSQWIAGSVTIVALALWMIESRLNNLVHALRNITIDESE